MRMLRDRHYILSLSFQNFNNVNLITWVSSEWMREFQRNGHVRSPPFHNSITWRKKLPMSFSGWQNLRDISSRGLEKFSSRISGMARAGSPRLTMTHGPSILAIHDPFSSTHGKHRQLHPCWSFVIFPKVLSFRWNSLSLFPLLLASKKDFQKLARYIYGVGVK